jgi:hypothetical protein
MRGSSTSQSWGFSKCPNQELTAKSITSLRFKCSIIIRKSWHFKELLDHIEITSTQRTTKTRRKPSTTIMITSCEKQCTVSNRTTSIWRVFKQWPNANRLLHSVLSSIYGIPPTWIAKYERKQSFTCRIVIIHKFSRNGNRSLKNHKIAGSKLN